MTAGQPLDRRHAPAAALHPMRPLPGAAARGIGRPVEVRRLRSAAAAMDRPPAARCPDVPWINFAWINAAWVNAAWTNVAIPGGQASTPVPRPAVLSR